MEMNKTYTKEDLHEAGPSRKCFQTRTVSEHRIAVDGDILVEKRVAINFPTRTFHTHIRCINGHYYSQLHEELPGQNRLVLNSTSMSEDQIASFRQEWEAKWRFPQDEELVVQIEAGYDRELFDSLSDTFERDTILENGLISYPVKEEASQLSDPFEKDTCSFEKDASTDHCQKS